MTRRLLSCLSALSLAAAGLTAAATVTAPATAAPAAPATPAATWDLIVPVTDSDRALAVSDDGQYVAFDVGSSTVAIVDTGTGAAVKSVTLPTTWTADIEFDAAIGRFVMRNFQNRPTDFALFSADPLDTTITWVPVGTTINLNRHGDGLAAGAWTASGTVRTVWHTDLTGVAAATSLTLPESGPGNYVDVAQGGDGTLYLLGSDGAMYRLRPDGQFTGFASAIINWGTPTNIEVDRRGRVWINYRTTGQICLEPTDMAATAYRQTRFESAPQPYDDGMDIDAAGNLYVLASNGGPGGVYRLAYEPAAVAGVTLPAALTLGVGESKPLTAEVDPPVAEDVDVTWTSSNPAVAALAAAAPGSAFGSVTGVAPGTATLTATTSDGGFTASTQVTVSAPPAPTEPGGGEGPGESGDGSGSGSGSASGSGSGAGADGGSSGAADGSGTGAGGSANADAATAAGQVRAVELPQDVLYLAKGTGAKVPVAVTLAGGAVDAGGAAASAAKAAAGAVWTSSNPKVAKVNARTGKITALRTGTVRLTVTVGGVSTTLTVKVVAKPVKLKKVTITKAPRGKALKRGQARQLKAKLTPAGATGVVLKWSSSRPAVAKVSAKGKVKALAKGKATITVKAGTKKAKLKLTVK